MALGMEMFQRPFQKPLDAYAQNKLREATMLTLTAWKKRWGYPYSLYRPLIQLATAKKMKLLALNADAAIVKAVAKKGLAKLPSSQREQLPELDLANVKHRTWFDAQMASIDAHGGHTHGKSLSPAEQKARDQRIYTAQVLWDETMAETATNWLQQAENSQIVILAGSGHCHDSGIVGRLKRRGITNTISVHPIIDDGNGKVTKVLQKPIYDYLFVLIPEASTK